MRSREHVRGMAGGLTVLLVILSILFVFLGVRLEHVRAKRLFD